MDELLHFPSRPETAPLADAKKNLACACTALKAAASLQPRLGQRIGMLHVRLLDSIDELKELERG